MLFNKFSVVVFIFFLFFCLFLSACFINSKPLSSEINSGVQKEAVNSKIKSLDCENIYAKICDYNKKIGLSEEEILEKNDKIMRSPSRFYQALPFVFYEDIFIGGVSLSERKSPRAVITADPHTGNFGISADKKGNVIWSVNDFDLSGEGLVEWDLMRLSASLVLKSEDIFEDSSYASDAIKALVLSYRREVSELSLKSPKFPGLTIEESFGDIKKKMLRAKPVSIEKYIEKNCEYSDGVLSYTADDETIPGDEALKEKLSAALERFFSAQNLRCDIEACSKKLGRGGSSFGLNRYEVLASFKNGKDYAVLELKQLLPEIVNFKTFSGHADLSRADAGQIRNYIIFMGCDFDPYLGFCEIDGYSYLIRQRDRLKSKKTDKFKTESDLRDFAAQAGKVLARIHCRTSEKTFEVKKWLDESDDLDKLLYDFSVDYALVANERYVNFCEACARDKRGTT